MLNPEANGALESMYGSDGIQFVKMRQKDERRVLNQEERKSAINAALHDTSALKELIKRSREGDIQAVEAIYELFNRPLYNLVYRYTFNREVAEDLLQDIFVKIFINLKNLRRDDTFVGWLYRIAINTCYSYLRGSRRPLQKTISLSEIEGRIDERKHKSGDKMMKKSLDNAIQSLPGKLKTIFLLHDVQGFKHREIARMLGCSVGTSKSQLFKARMKIRKHLKNKQAI